MKIALIVAMASNRVIGKDNGLVWHLPGDLRYFKAKTMGKPIIMGRKTFDSIGKPLPGRTNIIITRDVSYEPDGVSVVHSIDDAIDLADTIALTDSIGEIMIIGGAQIYAQSLAMADRLYVTEVHSEIDGDAFFPIYNKNDWQEVAREDFKACEKNPYDYSFVTLDKR